MLLLSLLVLYCIPTASLAGSATMRVLWIKPWNCLCLVSCVVFEPAAATGSVLALEVNEPTAGYILSLTCPLVLAFQGH